MIQWKAWRPAILTWIAYLDMVMAAFASVMELRKLALLFTVSGLLLVVSAFCFAYAGDDNGS